MRLIDADTLREKVNNCFEDVFNSSVSVSSDFMTFAKFVDKLIDNAPTVVKDYDTGYQDGLEDGLNDIRPKGEWLHKKVDCYLKEHGQCSNCLQRERVGNFCRNCGADMRGTTNEP